jgi:hypothetical protein
MCICISNTHANDEALFDVNSSIYKDQNGLNFRLRLKNISKRRLVFSDNVLIRDSIVLLLVEDFPIGGHQLKEVVGFNSPMINKLVLKPNTDKNFDFNLASHFPDINKYLEASNLLLFWSAEIYNVNRPSKLERFSGSLKIDSTNRSEPKLLSEKDLELW